MGSAARTTSKRADTGRLLLTMPRGYQQRLSVKGSHSWALWDRVIITSNKHPDEWYEKRDLSNMEFDRRPTDIVHMMDNTKYLNVKGDFNNWLAEAATEDEAGDVWEDILQ